MDRAIFPALIENLQEMISWVRARALAAGFDRSETLKIELAMEECLVNIVLYAYPKEKGKIELSCQIDPQKEILFIIQDEGVAFNPLLQKPLIDPEIPLEKREIGKLGIHLMCSNMDDVHYERRGPCNILTFLKRF